MALPGRPNRSAVPLDDHVLALNSVRARPRLSAPPGRSRTVRGGAPGGEDLGVELVDRASEVRDGGFRSALSLVGSVCRVMVLSSWGRAVDVRDGRPGADPGTGRSVMDGAGHGSFSMLNAYQVMACWSDELAG